MSRRRESTPADQLPEGRWPAEVVRSHVHFKDGASRWFVLYRNGKQTTVNYFKLENEALRAPIERTAIALGLEYEGSAADFLIENPEAAAAAVGWEGHVDVKRVNGRILTFPIRDEDA